MYKGQFIEGTRHIMCIASKDGEHRNKRGCVWFRVRDEWCYCKKERCTGSAHCSEYEKKYTPVEQGVMHYNYERSYTKKMFAKSKNVNLAKEKILLDMLSTIGVEIYNPKMDLKGKVIDVKKENVTIRYYDNKEFTYNKQVALEKKTIELL